MGRELVRLVVYSAKPAHGAFPINVEVLVARLALAEPHHLYVGHEKLHLVVSLGKHFPQQSGSLGILHTRQTHKSQIVKSLRSVHAQTIGEAQTLASVKLRRI